MMHLLIRAIEQRLTPLQNVRVLTCDVASVPLAVVAG
jgi:hypothetical protein